MVVYASSEDFIYIILGIAWVVYSAYNAKKKKEAKKNPASANKNKSFLDSIISEMGLPSEKSEQTNKESEQIDEYAIDNIEPEITPIVEPQVLYSYDDEYEESNYTPPYNIIKTEPVIESSNADTVKIDIAKNLNENIYTSKKKDNMKKIDLRRAVIYSAILKKVYF